MADKETLLPPNFWDKVQNNWCRECQGNLLQHLQYVIQELNQVLLQSPIHRQALRDVKNAALLVA